MTCATCDNPHGSMVRGRCAACRYPWMYGDIGPFAMEISAEAIEKTMKDAGWMTAKQVVAEITSVDDPGSELVRKFHDRLSDSPRVRNNIERRPRLGRMNQKLYRWTG